MSTADVTGWVQLACGAALLWMHRGPAAIWMRPEQLRLGVEPWGTGVPKPVEGALAALRPLGFEPLGRQHELPPLGGGVTSFVLLDRARGIAVLLPAKGPTRAGQAFGLAWSALPGNAFVLTSAAERARIEGPTFVVHGKAGDWHALLTAHLTELQRRVPMHGAIEVPETIEQKAAQAARFYGPPAWARLRGGYAGAFALFLMGAFATLSGLLVLGRAGELP